MHAFIEGAFIDGWRLSDYISFIIMILLIFSQFFTLGQVIYPILAEVFSCKFPIVFKELLVGGIFGNNRQCSNKRGIVLLI